MKRVLVTGASGFIAQHLIPALVENGLDVVALSRSRPSVTYQRTELRLLDVTDRHGMKGVADGCDTVIHLAGVAHRIGQELSDDDFDRVNVEGTRIILEQAIAAGVARFLFLSSALVGDSSSERPLTEEEPPRPREPYARSKARAEQLVIDTAKKTPMWTAILRPPMVYGPGNRGNLPRLASLIRRGVPLPFGAVANSRSVLFIDNLVSAMMLLLDREPGRGDIFYVADDTPLSTASLAREISSALGTPARIVAIPGFLLKSIARAGDAMARVARFPFTTRELNKLTGSLVVSDAKLRRLSGYVPRVSTAEGIRISFSPAGAMDGAKALGGRA